MGWPIPAEFPSEHALGANFPPFTPLFHRKSLWVDRDQCAIAQLPEQGALICGAVPGFLRKADALLLYELAAHAAGPILEIGSAWGLSTTILGRGARSARPPVRLTSIELNPDFVSATQAAVRDARLDGQVSIIQGEASQVVTTLAAKRCQYALVFVDHDHSLTATQAICHALPQLLSPGGFAVFHDFNDARNCSEPSEYGVYGGVRQLLEGPMWQFQGITGCCAVVRRMTT